MIVITIEIVILLMKYLGECGDMKGLLVSLCTYSIISTSYQ